MLIKPSRTSPRPACLAFSWRRVDVPAGRSAGCLPNLPKVSDARTVDAVPLNLCTHRSLLFCLCAQGCCRKHQPRGCHIVVLAPSANLTAQIFWVSVFHFFLGDEPPRSARLRCQARPANQLPANQALVPTAGFGEWSTVGCFPLHPSKVSPGTPNLVKRWSNMAPTSRPPPAPPLPDHCFSWSFTGPGGGEKEKKIDKIPKKKKIFSDEI